MHTDNLVQRQLIKTVKTAAHRLGVPGVFRALKKNGVRILMYHRFGPETKHLERQCGHIRRYYHPVTLGQVAESYRVGTPLPSRAVAITIDDGYGDFLEYGHPVFHKYELPATMFLVSDFVDGRLWLWVDVVDYVFARTSRPSVMPSSSGGMHQLMCRTAEERRAAAAQLCAALKEVDNDERLRTLTELARALDVDVPAAPPREYRPLTWDEIRRLARAGVDFGAHTKTHPILSRVKDPKALEEEVVVPKARIEAELGTPVQHFCYPNGRQQDFSDATLDALARAGFRAAVTTERGLNFADAQPMMLRRLGVGPDDPLSYFEELLSGMRAQ